MCVHACLVVCMHVWWCVCACMSGCVCVHACLVVCVHECMQHVYVFPQVVLHEQVAILRAWIP